MKIREPYYTKAGKNTFLGIGLTGISVALTAIIMPLIVVHFGTENWGRYSFFLLYVAVMAFVESTLQMYILQRTATAISTVTSYYWASDRHVLLLFFGLVILSGLMVGFNSAYGLTHDTELNNILMLVFVNVFPRGVSSIIKGKMLGLNSQGKYYAITTVLSVTRPLIILLAMLLFKPTILWLVVIYVLFSFVEMTTYLMLDASLKNPSQCPTMLHEVDSNVLLSLLLFNVLSVLAANLDKILVFTSVNLKLAGEYTLASTVAGLLYFFVNVASSAFAPKFKELFLHGDKQILRAHIYGITFINNVVMMFSIACFYFTGDYLLQAISTNLDRYSVMETFLLLATANLFSSNLWIPGIVAVSIGKGSFPVKTHLLFVCSYLVIFYVITSLAAQQTFAQSMLLAAIVATTIGIVYFKFSIFQISITNYALLLVALPMALVGLLITPLWGLEEYFKSLWVNLSYLLAISMVIIGIWCRARDFLRTRLGTVLEIL